MCYYEYDLRHSCSPPYWCGSSEAASGSGGGAIGGWRTDGAGGDGGGDDTDDDDDDADDDKAGALDCLEFSESYFDGGDVNYYLEWIDYLI